MNEDHFVQYVRQAKRLREDENQKLYWSGYLWGLRRHYFGESFGTPEDHQKLLNDYRSDSDHGRQSIAKGYEKGFQGEAPTEQHSEDLAMANCH